MKGFLLSLVLLFSILMGCSSEDETLITDLRSKEEGKYNVAVFDNEITSEDYQAAVLNVTNKLMEDSISSVSFDFSAEDSSISETLDITQFPEIIVFGNKGLVFRTYEVNELESFLK